MSGFASAFLTSAVAAAKVASLDLCADEYLLLLARPAEIASVSRVGRDREDSFLWRRAARFATNDGTVEGLIGTRPMIALRTGGRGRASEAIAVRLGIRTVTLAYPATIAEVAANMRQVATLLGNPHRADWWTARLDRLSVNPPATRDTIFLSGGGQSVAVPSLGADWMRLAGFAQRPLPQARASLEQLATRPSAVLLTSTYRAGQASLGQRWADHPLVRNLPSRRVTTDGRPWTCAGPMMLFEVERLRARR
ncbi:hypothetical protein ABDK56_01625 [Sphingomonas sp. ASV193]|uniref:ABC transporter substrate-binding protein n=1 Tax=Sphingomonas sp. ASV193 TaxID=3144405 RepID=UPI0032E8B12B